MTVNSGKKRVAGCYRIKDPIRNFKIRVKVVQQKSLLAELLMDEGETRDTSFLEEEVHIFGWQEKIFSPHEIKYYGDKVNCVTDHQRKYHENIKERNVQGSYLYSYTENDSYYADDALLTKPYRTCLARRNELALPALHNRKPFSERYNKVVVDEMPNETRIRSNHYFYTNCNFMYILADLTRKDDVSNLSDPSGETLLCSISYDKAHNILKIDPDFAYDDPYVITNANGIKYDCWIEHASEKQSPLELKRQREISQREIHQWRIQKETADVANELKINSQNVLRIYINLDILSAHNFSFDGLFVTYCVDLPQEWNVTEKEKLIGRTQKSYNRNKCASFGYPVDMYMDLLPNLHRNNDLTSTSWPRLLISIASLDSWTRYRTEGYGTLALPTKPGSYEFNIPTWRPRGNVIDCLRRFFTGGTYELEDITYCGIPSIHSGSVLDKLNLNVISSGYVKVRLNIVHQGQMSVTNSNHRRGSFDRLSTNTLMDNVASVFEQFKAARERMIQIRSLPS